MPPTETSSPTAGVRCVRSLIAVLVIAAIANAQKREVVPRNRTSVEGNHSIPFPAKRDQFTWQLLFPVDARLAGRVSHVSFRRDWQQSRGMNTPAFDVDLEILAGHAKGDHHRPSWTYASNRSKDVVTALRRRKVRMPAVRWQQGAPFPFTWSFKFDKPLTLVSGKTALLEFRFFESTLANSENPWIDMERSDYSGTRYARRYIGTNCGAGRFDNLMFMQPLVVGQASEASKLPHSLNTTKTFGLFYGGTSASRWGGLKLPLDLAPYGAPGCNLYISLEWMWPAIETTPQGARAALDLPNDARLVGKTVFIQGIVFNTPSNRLGVGLTQGIAAVIGPRIPTAGMLITPPARPFPYFAANGSRFAGALPVIQLRYQ